MIGSPLSPAEIRVRAEDLGLSIDLYQPFRDFEAVPTAQLERNLHRAEAKFDVMDEHGATMILVCSNVSPDAIDDDELAAEQLRRLAEAADAHGIRIAYEALAWGSRVNEYDHAWRIVELADHPALGTCLDSFHILSRGTPLDTIEHIPPEKLLFVQLADAPHLQMDVLQWSRHYRCFPGQGGFDLAGFVGHALATGYRGPLSLEVFNDIFRQADAERTATDALRSLIVLEEELSTVELSTVDAVAAPGSAALRERVELSRPPTPVEPAGFAFVEIAVDPLAEEAADILLHGLGFTRVARHRSKPVQLWQQADIRILLNRARPGVEDRTRGDAAIAAIAVESPDPARSGLRAEALLAPAIPRRYG